MIQPATLADLKELDSLRRANQEAVSFVPYSRYAEVVERCPSNLLTFWDNGDMTGYLYWTAGTPVGTIQQVVVRHDARRGERATALVTAALEAMSPWWERSAESNFWQLSCAGVLHPGRCISLAHRRPQTTVRITETDTRFTRSYTEPRRARSRTAEAVIRRRGSGPGRIRTCDH